MKIINNPNKTVTVINMVEILKNELIKTQKELAYEKKLRRKNQWVKRY